MQPAVRKDAPSRRLQPRLIKSMLKITHIISATKFIGASNATKKYTTLEDFYLLPIAELYLSTIMPVARTYIN